jgi:predicted aspartyl protease
MNQHLKVPSIPRQESAVSVLEHEVTVIGSKGSARCHALFDSGATYSIIRRDIAERIGPLDLLPDPENWVFETARAGELIQALYRVTLNFRFDDSLARFSDEFVVFDNCSEELIVGAKTLQAWHIILDFQTETVLYRKKAERLRV